MKKQKFNIKNLPKKSNLLKAQQKKLKGGDGIIIEDMVGFIVEDEVVGF